MMPGKTISSPPNQIEGSSDFVKLIRIQIMKFNTLVDRTTPYTTYRWITAAVLLSLFMVRIVLVQGWFLVTYALWIYLLNLFLAFLQPKFDPSLQMESLDNEDEINATDDGVSLPQSRDDEFRPFVRRLPEFKFWYGTMRAILICFFCTFFEMFDVPVFWPILLMYFIILFFLTMRRQIRHMIKYNYIPFDIGKKKYAKK